MIKEYDEYVGYFWNREGQCFNAKSKRPLKMIRRGNRFAYPLWRKAIEVAFVMATLYVENPNNYEFYDFIDGNTLNHKIDNLFWSKYPHQKKHVKGKGLKAYNSALSKKKVLEIRRLLAQGELKQTEIAKQLGVTKNRVTDIKRGYRYNDVK
jgi:DNA-binding XRE family transcriptional regulator